MGSIGCPFAGLVARRAVVSLRERTHHFDTGRGNISPMKGMQTVRLLASSTILVAAMNAVAGFGL